MDIDTQEYIDDRIRATRLASYVRLVLGMTGAVFVTLVVINSTIRVNEVDGCVRRGAQWNAAALNWEQAAKVRRKHGDEETASIYITNAHSIRNNTPSEFPKVTDIEQFNARARTPGDRRDGCENAYPVTLLP